MRAGPANGSTFAIDSDGIQDNAFVNGSITASTTTQTFTLTVPISSAGTIQHFIRRLTGGNITIKDIKLTLTSGEVLTDSDATSRSHLAGIEYATNLEFLSLSGNAISNLSMFEPGIRLGREEQGELGLRNLQYLDLDFNPIIAAPNEAYPPTVNRPLEAVSRLQDLEFLSIDALAGRPAQNSPVGTAGLGTSYDLRDVSGLDRLRKLSARGLNLGAAGKPDWSFGNSVTSSEPLNSWLTLPDPNGYGWIYDAALQDDGKLIVIGSRAEPGQAFGEFVVSRLHPDGSFDSTFGNDGSRRIPLLANTSLPSAMITFAGNIYVAGLTQGTTSSSTRQVALAILNSVGEVTSTHMTDLLADAEGIGDMTVQQVGNTVRIVLTGFARSTTSSSTYNSFLLRYHTNGTPDDTFNPAGTTGRKHLREYELSGTSHNDSGQATVTLADGSILFAGGKGDANLTTAATTGYLAKAKGSGANPSDLDPTFGVAGLKEYRFGKERTQVISMASVSGGKFVLTGITSDTISGAFDSIFVARVKHDGSLDTSFGNQGLVKVSWAADQRVDSVVALPDGKLLVVGYSLQSGTDWRPALVRLKADGQLDSGFGEGGLWVDPIGGTQQDEFRGVVVDASGALIAVGGSEGPAGDGPSQQRMIARYLADDAFAVDQLAGLSNLQVLTLSDNQIRDISDLAGLSNLTWLDIDHNRVESIDALLGQTIVTVSDHGQGYQESGTGFGGGDHPEAFEGQYRLIAGQATDSVAGFHFKDLDIGTYDLYASWPAPTARSAGATITIVGEPIIRNSDNPATAFQLFHNRQIATRQFPSRPSENVVIDSTRLSVTSNGQSATTLFGSPFSLTVSDGIMRLAFAGDLAIPANSTIVVTGDLPLSVEVDGDLYFGENVTVDGSANGTVPGPGGGGAGSVRAAGGGRGNGGYGGLPGDASNPGGIKGSDGTAGGSGTAGSAGEPGFNNEFGAGGAGNGGSGAGAKGVGGAGGTSSSVNGKVGTAGGTGDAGDGGGAGLNLAVGPLISGGGGGGGGGGSQGGGGGGGGGGSYIGPPYHWGIGGDAGAGVDGVSGGLGGAGGGGIQFVATGLVSLANSSWDVSGGVATSGQSSPARQQYQLGTNGIAGASGTGGKAGDGGLAGTSGHGGSGAGGSVLIQGTVVSASGTLVNAAGGNGSGNDGGTGRFIIGDNSINPSLFNPSAASMNVTGARIEAYAGSMSVNPYLPDSPQTPNIVGVFGGADSFGLLGDFDPAGAARLLDAADILSSDVLVSDNEETRRVEGYKPNDAIAVMTRSETGPPGFGPAYSGFDFITITLLGSTFDLDYDGDLETSANGIANPRFGIGGILRPLAVNDNGEKILSSLGAWGDLPNARGELGTYEAGESLGSVFVTLIPKHESLVRFSATIDGTEVQSQGSMSAGDVLYVTPREFSRFEVDQTDSSNNATLGESNWTYLQTITVEEPGSRWVSVAPNESGPALISAMRLERHDRVHSETLNLAGNPLNERAMSSIVPAMSTLGQIEMASAEIGPTGNLGGVSVNPGQFIGTRFYVDQPLHVTEVGGHLRTFGGTGPFAAIVALDSVNDFPDSTSLSTADVQAHAIIPLTAGESTDAFATLNTTLEPGWYAIVIGSGLFGSTGNSVAPTNNDATDASNLFGMFNGSYSTDNSLSGIRLVVRGHVTNPYRTVDKTATAQIEGISLDERPHDVDLSAIGPITVEYGQGVTTPFTVVSSARTRVTATVDRADLVVTVQELRPGDFQLTVTPQTAAEGIANITLTAAAVVDSITEYRQNVLATSGLIGYWPLDEVTGGTAQDLSGNGRHGQTTGTLASSLTTPIVGDPASTDFHGGAVTVAGLNVAAAAAGFNTISFWMNWDGTEGVMPLSFTNYDLLFYTGFFGFNTNESNVYGITSAGLLNRWVHVAATFANNGILSNQLYVDGVEQRLSLLRGTAGSVRAATSSVVIGGFLGSTGLDTSYRFDGRLNELAIFNRALSPEEIQGQVAAGVSSHVTGRSDKTTFSVSVGRGVSQGVQYQDLDGNGLRNGTNVYQETALELGAIKFLSLNELSGMAVADVTGNSPASVRDATTRSGVPGAWGFAGDAAYEFYGGMVTVGDPAEAAHAPDKSATGVNTVSFMMKWDGTATSVPLGLSTQHLIFSAGKFGIGRAPGGHWATSAVGLQDRWVHVVAEFHNDSITRGRVWLDGVEQQLTLGTNGDTVPSAAGGLALTIGGSPMHTGYRFSGALDDIAMFNRALTSSEIAALSAAASTPYFEPGGEGSTLFLDGYVEGVYTPQLVNGQLDSGETLAVSAVDGAYHFVGLALDRVYDVRHELSAAQSVTQAGNEFDYQRQLATVPGPLPGDAGNFISYGDRLYFSANTAVYGKQLYVYDGQTYANVLADADQPDGVVFDVREPVLIGNAIYFAGSDSALGTQLWKYTIPSGSAVGTVQRVTSVNPGPGLAPEQLVAVGNDLYFTADDGRTGRELWRYDGNNAELALDLQGSDGVWGVRPSTGEIVKFDTQTGRDVYTLPAPGNLASAHTSIGLSMSADQSRLLYSNHDDVNGRIYELDPLTGAVLAQRQTTLAPLTGLSSVYTLSETLQLEPDSYVSGTVVNAIHPQITLSTAPGWDVEASSYGGWTAPTGTLYFRGGCCLDFNDDQPLRAAFSTPVGSVSFDTLGSAAASAVLEAYDQSGNLLDRVVTATRTTRPAQRVEILRATNEIAYVLAYGTPDWSVVFDNLIAKRYVPSTLTIDGTRIAAIAANGTVSTFLTNVGQPVALAGDGQSRQFLVNSAGSIIEFTAATPSQIVSNRSLGIANVVGLAFDGEDLFVTDTAGAIHVVDPGSLAVERSIVMPAGRLLGLATRADVAGVTANNTIHDMTALGSTLFFEADYGTGYRLWMSRTDGVVQVVEVSGVAVSEPRELTVSDDAIYLKGVVSGNQERLIKVDQLGTAIIVSAQSIPASVLDAADHLTAHADGLVFDSIHESIANRRELWKLTSDGQAQRLTDLPTGISIPSDAVVRSHKGSIAASVWNSLTSRWEVLVVDSQGVASLHSMAGSSGVWGVDAKAGEIVQVEPATGKVLRRFPVPGKIKEGDINVGLSIAEDGQSLIYANTDSDPGKLYRIEPYTGELLSLESVGTTAGIHGLTAEPSATLSSIASWNMTANPNWVLTGTWQWADPVGLSGDPQTGKDQTNVLSSDPAGAYSHGLGGPLYAQTPAINTRGYVDVEVSFDRWLGVEASYYDHATIEMSVDGRSWTTIWQNGTQTIQDTSWVPVSYPLGNLASNQASLYLRWTIGPTGGSSYSNYSGWNLDNVVVKGRTQAIYQGRTGQEIRRQTGYSGSETGGWATGVPTGGLAGDGWGRAFAVFPNQTIREFSIVSDTNSFIRSVPSPAPDVQGLAFDGTYLYASTPSGRLYTLQPNTGQIVAETFVQTSFVGLGAVGSQFSPTERPEILSWGETFGVVAGPAGRARQLWVFDGTNFAEGPDVRPGADGSDPQEVVQFGAELLFSADDGRNGRELWAVGDTVHGAYRVDLSTARVATALDFGATDVVVAPPATNTLEGEFRQFTATITAPKDANRARYRLELLRVEADGQEQLVDVSPWTDLIRADGSGIDGQVVTHAFRVPDDGNYRVRTTVDAIVAGDGSVAIDLGENETAVASVVDSQGRTITAVYRELIGGVASTSAGYLVAHLPTGQLDQDFGVNGIAYVSADRPEQLIHIVSGDFDNGFAVLSVDAGTVRLTRLSATGQLFTESAVTEFAFAGTATVIDTELQNDGTVWVLAAVTPTSGAAAHHLLPFLADGSTGQALPVSSTVDVAGNPRAFDPTALTLRSNNDLLVTGIAQDGTDDSVVAVLTYDAQQILTQQLLSPTVGNASNDHASRVLINSQGRTLFAYQSESSGQFAWKVTRYLETGLLDASFGSAGTHTIDFGATDVSLVEFDLDSLGRLILTGSQQLGEGGQYQAVVARLTAAGQMDTTFATGGILQLGRLTDLPVQDAVLGTDNSITLTLNATIAKSAGQDQDGLIVRILSTGVPDYSFGGLHDPLTYVDTQAVVAAAVAPSFNLAGLPTPVEQVAWNHAIPFTDPGQDQWTATVDYGDGTVVQFDRTELADKSFLLQHRYQDDGQYTVTVSIHDVEDLLAATHSVTLTVTAAAPLLQLPAGPSAPEGAVWTASGSVRDGDDQLLVQVDYGDGAPLATLSLYPLNVAQGLYGFDLSHVYANDGSYLVTVTAWDRDDQVWAVPVTQSASIINVAPLLDGVLTYPATAIEGEHRQFQAAFVDLGADTLTVEWDFDYDGVSFSVDATGDDLQYAFPDNVPLGGSYVVAVRAFDGTDYSAVTTTHVESRNVNPTVDISSLVTSRREGELFSFNGLAIASDVSGDPLTFEWQITDSLDNVVASSTSPQLDFLPADDGLYTLTLRVRDDDFDETLANNDPQRGEFVETIPLSVTNVAPGVAILGPATAVEGEAITFTASVTEPGISDTSLLTYAWTIHDEGDVPVSNGSSTTLAFTPPDEGTYWVTLSVSDDDSTVTARHALVVSNANPSLQSLQIVDGLPANVPVRVSGSFADSALGDEHTATISINPTLPVKLAGQNFAFDYLFPGPGTYEVEFQVRDLDGGVSTQTHTIVVGPADLQPPAVTVNPQVTTDTSPLITGTVDDPAASVTVSLAGQTFSAVTVGDGTWFLADNSISPPFASGQHVVQVVATDQAGNSSQDFAAITVVIHSPTDLEVDQLPITETNQPAPTDLLFGSLSATDLDLFDEFDFDLVAGDGATDNSRFYLDEDEIYLRAGELLDFETQSSYQLRVRATDLVGNTFEKALELQLSDVAEPAAVLNRQVFYHRAPGTLFANSGSAQAAIDSTKVALLPGQASSFANYTNYVRGLNGIVVDVANLAEGISANDFEFAVWNGIAAEGFQNLTVAATVTPLTGAGLNGSTRLKVELPDQAVRNTWLRVTLKANANTGLAADDVFYFGNAVADFNVGNLASTGVVRVNASDTAAVRLNQSIAINSVGVINTFDVNKDGRVNASDTSLVRLNQAPQLIRHFTAPTGD